MNFELKPCPFCGGEAELSEDEFFCRYSVVCTKCGAETAAYGVEQDAIDAWNNRVQPTQPTFTPDEIDAIRRMFEFRYPILPLSETETTVINKCNRILKGEK